MVSVIIPTLNAGRHLLDLLQAIKAQRIPGAIEVVVIDSESQDGTVERAREAGAKVVSVSRRRFNHGQTRNLAIQASRGKFLALTVQDAEPSDANWLARLLTPLLERARVAGSYGLQVALPTSGLLAKTRSALWAERHDQPLVQSLKNAETSAESRPEQRLDMIRFDNVTSCVRRSVWETMPFPECDYGEDMAWAQQALLEGYEVVYVPSAKVWHAHERGLSYEFRRAYVDGRRRVDLVQWPSLRLTLGDVAAILRRMAFFLRTHRFDSMCNRAEIYRFLTEEANEYGAQKSTNDIQVYLDILSFAWNLSGKALELVPGDELPDGAWIDLFRFATVAVVGQNMGATAGAARARDARTAKAAWGMANLCVGRGI